MRRACSGLSQLNARRQVTKNGSRYGDYRHDAELYDPRPQRRCLWFNPVRSHPPFSHNHPNLGVVKHPFVIYGEMSSNITTHPHREDTLATSRVGLRAEHTDPTARNSPGARRTVPRVDTSQEQTSPCTTARCSSPASRHLS